MVRSMFSGVAGMRAHQQRMDVIGNNIANVNTYGFKSSRATFRDMFYQSIRNASAGTTTKGGVNPSAIGYGSSISSVDLLMTQSSMTPTGNPLDVCIAGEGFLQVMDADGNTFYTKAGMLNLDPNGYLVDSNGYFVLGTQADNQKMGVLGKEPGSEKIRFELGSLEQKEGSVTKKLGDYEFTVSSSSMSSAGNANIYFNLDSAMPVGQDMKAIVDGTTITLNINPEANFDSMGAFQTAMNKAITEALGGTPHPAGDFKISASPMPGFPLTGKELVSSNNGPSGGGVAVDDAVSDTGISVKSVGSAFSGEGDATYAVVQNGTGTADDPFLYDVTVDIGGTQYTATGLTASQLSHTAGIELKNGTVPNDTMVIKLPKADEFAANGGTVPDNGALGTATPQTPSKNVGLGSTQFQLTGGTEGGQLELKNITGLAIGADGTIVGEVNGEKLTFGRIDLANFDNASALVQSGNSYFAESANSGKVKVAVPGEDGTGQLKNSALEMSNVDLSQEFSDMITTQRGFQANSRIITVSDTMLEELVNLKR